MKRKHNILTYLLLLLMVTLFASACSGNQKPSGEQGTENSDNSTKNPNVGKEVSYLVEPEYDTKDSIVAAADVTLYGADPTGEKDSSDAFRQALKEVGKAGGGTVWVPAGKYIISKNLNVPSMVTLRGDWNDPDAEGFNGEYGTIIMANVQSSTSQISGMIQMAECSGVEGITIYYPEQDIADVKAYSPTFYLAGDIKLRTIKNVTLINSYIGVYVGGINESTILRNVKGTCLVNGIELHSVSDVGVFDDVTFSPKYWANAGNGLKKADKDAIVKYCKDNKSSGFLMHDLEQQQFSRITVEGYEYGIFFSAQPTRFMASGPMYQVNISDCSYGIYAEEGTYESPTKYAFTQCPILTSIDWRCGYIISDSNISGTKYSIYNGCPQVVSPQGIPYQAYIHLAGVTLTGDTYGNVTYTANGKDLDLSANDMKDDSVTKTTGTAFEALKDGASEEDIQAALDKVGKAGGGVVYLAAGNYDITTGLTVPENTEIVGAAGSAQRVPDKGTVLWCKQTGSSTEQRNAAALVTLSGDNAGISGLYFMYDSNIYAIDKGQMVSYYPFAVRGQGKGVWAVDCCIAGASHGIDFNNCDNHVIDSLYSCCMYSHIEVSGNNGIVRNSLANATVIYRTNGVVVVNEYAAQENYFEKWGKPYSNYITVGKGSGQQLYNNFMYGGKRLVYIDGGTEVTGVNLGTDNIGSYAVEMNTGSAVISNVIITTQQTFHNVAGKLLVYNPLRNFDPNLADYISIK